jgi:galactose mutarotase-like enzyme
VLPATFGAHPGFNVPFSAGHDFSEYTLTFAEVCTPNQMGITPEGYYTGQCRALPLENGNTLALDHEKFAVDGIFVSRMARKVTLGAAGDPHGVTLEFADFPYLGVWQEYGKDTPFLCLEPWCGLPSYPDRHFDGGCHGHDGGREAVAAAGGLRAGRLRLYLPA